MAFEEDYLKIHSKFKYFVFLCLYYLLYPLAKIIYGSKKKWLICDRRDDAQDNAFFFFKFLAQYHREIKPTFLIDKDYKKKSELECLGKVVNFCSFKHFMMAIGCPVKISSQIYGYAPWIQMSTYFRRHKTRDTHVFLQHGVIKNLHPNLFGDVCKSLKLFVCGAKPEYEFIFNEFHYKNNVPQYTGLARYDNLLSTKTKDCILLMPTWRAELFGFDNDSFINCRFFLEWNNLLTDKKFIEICKTNNLKVKFYLHHELQKYSSLFSSNDIVEIAKTDDLNVQSLLKEAKLLITDFSSVYFDFAFMKKPQIYFQFDEDTFYARHYQKGYFDYRRDGFGPVCLTKNQVITELDKCIRDNFLLDNVYEERVDKNFIYRDNHNCERIYGQIIRIAMNG